ncbi:hypothetical protein WG936_08930 [Corynebacterium sp. H127]|uniref:hypothetical protein n=1 Tax=Corynebacterium sp. H127 TaxID=3133418 RepID=UPI003094E53C
MPNYRLKPRLPVWKITGIVATLLLAPSLISLAVPELDSDRSPLVLSSPMTQWEIPINWPDGGPLTCEEGDELLMESWSCDGASVYSIVMEGSEDPENTLKRGMRAALLFPPGEGELVRDGQHLLYETDDAIGVATVGTGEHEGLMMVAVVSGAEQRPYSALILDAFRGGEGELPELEELGVAA